MHPSPIRASSLCGFCLFIAVTVLAAARPATSQKAIAQNKPAANPEPDVLVLVNGDTLHGKLVNAVAGKVTFHSGPLGDISVTWDKIKELHATEQFAVLDKNVKVRGRTQAGTIPVGSIEVTNAAITLQPENGAPAARIPVKDAEFVVDQPTLTKQLNHEPSFTSGWNGAATAGATLVTGTQNQYTFSGGIGLVRAVPTVAWLKARNRTSMDFTGSYGKITQPGYFAPPTPPSTAPTYVPPVVTKSAIYHADAERDEYLSARFFALAQTAFDHNYGQDLDLQQIYGGGLGYTAIKTPKQEADLKATVQYEKQDFITGSSSADMNLIGSTFSAAYILHLKRLTYTQGVAYIPAWNQTNAYSADETNTFAFPAWKNFAFSLGTLDSYLNDPPASLPPTKRNSFQFTMGLTYAIKSKY
jgi:hypothetical protein